MNRTVKGDDVDLFCAIFYLYFFTFLIFYFCIFVFAKSLVGACCLHCLHIVINRTVVFLLTVADGDVNFSQLFCLMAKRTFDIGVIDCPPICKEHC